MEVLGFTLKIYGNMNVDNVTIAYRTYEHRNIPLFDPRTCNLNDTTFFSQDYRICA